MRLQIAATERTRSHSSGRSAQSKLADHHRRAFRTGDPYADHDDHAAGDGMPRKWIVQDDDAAEDADDWDEVGEDAGLSRFHVAQCIIVDEEGDAGGKCA